MKQQAADQRDCSVRWLRGDLPTWLAVGMLAVLGWGAREAYHHFTSTLSRSVELLGQHERRIAVLEDWRASTPRQTQKE